MSECTLQVGLIDTITIKLSIANLNRIESTCSMELKELNEWYKQNERIYNKYKNKLEIYKIKKDEIRYPSNTEKFFYAYLYAEKFKAEIITKRFKEFSAVIIKELDNYKTMPISSIPTVNAHINAIQSSIHFILSSESNSSVAEDASIIRKKISEMQPWIEYRTDEVRARNIASGFFTDAQKYSTELDALPEKCKHTKEFDKWLEEIKEFIDDADFLIFFTEKYKISKYDIIYKAVESAREIKERIEDVREIISIGAAEYKRRREEIIRLVQPVEGRMLDAQQIDSIICDRENQLILAGAGTGKTTTIIGKVKYLLKTQSCCPEDILLLSFTNKSASEMRERVKAETGYDLDVMTFHKLGLNIISGVEGKKPTIYSKSIQEFTRENIKRHINEPLFRKNLLVYCFYSNAKYKTEFDFTSKREYDDYIDANPPITFKNEKVKSYCEMEIANFLFSNNINYSYEKPYEYDTADTEYTGYHPDFYLDDYGIYIEFYAVDNNGNVPEFFKGTHGESGQSEYLKGIEWKRKTHQENNTRLIELYYSDKQAGNLSEKLQKELMTYGVELKPMRDEELWDSVTEENTHIVSAVCDVIGTVITLAKSNGYDMQKLRSISPNANTPLLSLIEPIFADYSYMLSSTNQIDFNDMIFNASEYVRSGKVSHNYKYVIVDEYQDISKARYSLLNELRLRSPFKLFCVGDDWQSIYRFAGSDIGYILRFSDYWGMTRLSRIETTYRFSAQLISLTGKFIMKNPNQVQKSLKSNNDDNFFPLGIIKAYNDKYLVKFMANKINELEKNATVFLIGRYTFDKEMLNGDDFAVKYNNTTGTYDVKFSRRPDLRIEFITAHKSKGLQADYVFILNNKNKSMGFPSKIQDDPLIGLLLEGSDQYPFSEERRLFYVAMTRAKKKVWLLVQQDNPSCFACELIEEYGKQIKTAEWTCPLCGGRLVKRNGKNGGFFGCSNFAKTGCRYTKNIC